MCLHLRIHAVTGKILPFSLKKLTKHPKLKNTFVVYKILKEEVISYIGTGGAIKSKLVSLYYPGSKWEFGKEKKSDRKQKELTKLEKRFTVIDKGIHVYLRLPTYNSDLCDGSRVIVKCLAKLKDFVAINEKEAVFMAVTPIEQLKL